MCAHSATHSSPERSFSTSHAGAVEREASSETDYEHWSQICRPDEVDRTGAVNV